MKLLITGASGKVGRRLIDYLLSDVGLKASDIRALCHHRTIDGVPGLEIVKGSIADQAVCKAAMTNVTHVIHLATCKEIPLDVMDVTVKGLFWLLEEFRQVPTAHQFILIGGDACVGHFFYEHQGPITEQTPHQAYPGCYALSKVLEEVIVQQFTMQYGINACCLRAPWIMEKDDFRYTLSFGDDVFGGPRWGDIVGPEVAARCVKDGTVPLLLDAKHQPLRRNFVHVDDLVAAISMAFDNPATKGKTFNISMDEPVDYLVVADHLKSSRGLPSLEIPSSFYSNWLDNSAAKFALKWRPRIGVKELIDRSWDYRRSPSEPRKTWYPG
jgi:UDP-glucose 4-epimerase